MKLYLPSKLRVHQHKLGFRLQKKSGKSWKFLEDFEKRHQLEAYLLKKGMDKHTVANLRNTIKVEQRKAQRVSDVYLRAVEVVI